MNVFKFVFLFVSFALSTLTLLADIVVESIDYDHDGAICAGTLVYDNSIEGKLPCVIIFHQWAGPGDYELARAKMLAEQGYAAFVADVYTKSIRPQSVGERRVLTTAFKNDRPMTRARANAALAAVTSNEHVDRENIAAIGYCFGGMVTLEMARSGSPIKTAVSIHGSLNTPTPESATNITCSVLVQHGAIDPYVPTEELVAFKSEMTAAEVSYEVIEYADAVHAFTDWNAGNDPSGGAAYNEAADKKSWTDLLAHLEKSLK